MSGHLLIWGGPVASFDMKAQQLPDVTLLTISQGVGGIGSNAFRDLALSKVDGNGRILPTLLADKGLSIDQFEDISLAGFSAFHGMANEILKRDSDLVTACVCLDACFSSFEHLEKDGYVLFGSMAANEEKLFVMSGSLGGGQTFSTGVACVIANAQAAAQVAGKELAAVEVPEGVPVPTQALGVGGLVALDYQMAFTHVGHVKQLGGPLLDAYLAPWLLERKVPYPAPKPESQSSSSAGKVLGAVAGLALFTGVLVVVNKERSA